MTSSMTMNPTKSFSLNCLYLPLVSCSSEDTIDPVDDGKLNLLFLELVMDVLQKTKVYSESSDKWATLQEGKYKLL